MRFEIYRTAGISIGQRDTWISRKI